MMAGTYRTIQGDTWDMIAYKCYPDVGSEKLMHKLLAANTDYQDRVIFEAGVILTVPEIANPVVIKLPPWKRT